MNDNKTVLTDEEIAYLYGGDVKAIVPANTMRLARNVERTVNERYARLPAASDAAPVIRNPLITASEAGTAVSDDGFWPVSDKASRKDLVTQIGQMNYRLTALRNENAGLTRRVQGQAKALHNYQTKAIPTAPVEARAVPVSIGMVRWRNGEPFVALNKNGRELEAGSILFAAPVDAGARMDRDATISKVVGLCNRIPGATTWNAAEFMFDELVSAAPPSAPAAEPTLPYENALTELVNKIDSGLDSGNILADARRASAALDGVMAAGDLVANAYDHFKQNREAQRSPDFRIGWNACLDAIGSARRAAPAAESAEPECERCGLPPKDHTPTHWCDNQSFAQPAAATADAQGDDYEAKEREHLGDPYKRTGIYAQGDERAALETIATLTVEGNDYAGLANVMRATARAALSRQPSAAASAELPDRDPIIHAVASLAAAISLLERTPKAKKAAASDKMFDQMITDYRNALDNARAALAAAKLEGEQHGE